MKWKNHKILTFGIVFMATNNPLSAFYALSGSVFPDWIEGNPPEGSGYWQWRNRHRGISHWFLLYFFACSYIWFLQKRNFSFWGYPFVGDLCFYFLVGSMLHILEDAVCGKVPILFPGKHWGIKLFSVGSIVEYAFTFGILGICCYYGKYLAK